jgi:N-terminal acetyltransferase B complex non-catalytic subunit
VSYEHLWFISHSDQIRFRRVNGVQAEIEAHLDPASGIDKSWKRNASLAQVKLLFQSTTAFSTSQPNKVSAVVKYFQGYGKASTAYNDLRPFVEQLSSNERKHLLEILKNGTVFSDTGKPESGQSSAKDDVSC